MTLTRASLAIPGAPPLGLLLRDLASRIDRVHARLTGKDPSSAEQIRAPFDDLCDSLGLDALDREVLLLVAAPFLDDSIRKALPSWHVDTAVLNDNYISPSTTITSPHPARAS